MDKISSILSGLSRKNKSSELIEYRQKIDKSHLSIEAKQEAERELVRLENISMASSEYELMRTHLEWLISLPWKEYTGEVIDIQHARKVLDEDHYDLKKIKDRIIEYLAVKKLRNERSAGNNVSSVETASQSPNPAAQTPVINAAPNISLETPTDVVAREPIFCFVGPPGVGKTSLGQSIAHALGRKFLRISLSGIRESAEIHGQRPLRVGALPGRIIQSIKRCGTCNPIIMLDEIDKIANDWRDDPSSALLEVLDPVQNHNFIDHYLGIAFDLSHVLFIAAANTLDNIPEPLLDRMEVIYLAGYTDAEKIQIAERYLIPKQCLIHGLKNKEIEFNQEAIRHIIRGYTSEAGVRDLDRQIASICRKIVLQIINGQSDKIVVTNEVATKLLGRVKYIDDVAERTSRSGVATGLAWMHSGGDILFIEVAMMPSKSESFILTGMLGEVMRESAQIALSYVRSNLINWSLDPETLQNKAIHIHIPAGAIHKDGPSAGIAIVSALVSLISDKLVRHDVAMTGEINLRGQILPVGGVKEKVLAAHRAGIKTVILPKKNEDDLEDISEELKKELLFVFVESMEEILKVALTDK